jgi:transketolase
LNWGSAPFEVPEHLYREWDARQRGAALQQDWEAVFDRYRAEHPALAAELLRRMEGKLPEGWDQPIRALALEAQAAMAPLETRKSSQQCLGALAQTLPELFGGSADLTGSNGTRWKGAPERQYLSYGVREFGMSAMVNGMVLHGGLRPFAGTFLVFMEYARNAVRLSALMKIPSVWVYTHDSVALGEDGPTHQPIEQLSNLRTTPGMSVWRPCDTVESAFAWEAAMTNGGPTSLIFTRQKTPAQPRNAETFEAVGRGGYVLRPERDGAVPDALVIATGSEVSLAMAAADALARDGVAVRVVSMPSVDTFLAQDQAYRDAVLPPAVRARVAVEAAHPDYWYRFVGLDGVVVGIDRFGLSAPGEVAMETLGMTVDNVVAAVRQVAGRHSGAA